MLMKEAEDSGLPQRRPVNGIARATSLRKPAPDATRCTAAYPAWTSSMWLRRLPSRTVGQGAKKRQFARMITDHADESVLGNPARFTAGADCRPHLLNRPRRAACDRARKQAATFLDLREIDPAAGGGSVSARPSTVVYGFARSFEKGEARGTMTRKTKRKPSR